MMIIDIPKRSQQCSKGAEPFLPGSEYFALLQKNEEGAFLRFDYCKKCFDELELADKTYWKGRISESRHEPILGNSRDDKALNALRATLKEDSLEAREEAFVLSLYLARKKILILRNQLKQPDGKIFLYEVMETEELLAIPEVLIGALHVEAVQSRIATKLQ